MRQEPMVPTKIVNKRGESDMDQISGYLSLLLAKYRWHDLPGDGLNSAKVVPLPVTIFNNGTGSPAIVKIRYSGVGSGIIGFAKSRRSLYLAEGTYDILVKPSDALYFIDWNGVTFPSTASIRWNIGLPV